MWNKRPGGVQAESAPEVTVEAFLRQDSDKLQLVDVREPDEWAAGHVAGAVLLPLDDLAARQSELDPHRPVVTICRSGRRSLTAAEMLLDAGFTDVRSLAGGMIAWVEAGQPIVV